ncbi:assimilatory sulfite reductase [Trichodelitschia bisporula]|uniref:assimilatory sulfite reductase (NADPH) n=1 Tax=Trichodelitschia bisporula TaxID=703511 RepID=A0A6G1HT30_9PEZI|nr:assimilatory sulfite reductase [Trichodelitschia bisporula]
MHLQQPTSAGPAAGPTSDSTAEQKTAPFRQLDIKSSSLPFGRDAALSSIGGPTYATAATLIQHVAYSLSDKVFSYSPESFDLDLALRHWNSQNETNAFGYTPAVHSIEARAGAGAVALGYIFSQDFDLEKRHIPETIVAPSATLPLLRTSLDQLSLLYSLASPVVVHVAAVDYSSGPNPGLVSDYVSALQIADDLGLALLASTSTHDAQHMALLATLIAKVLPAIHVFDGVKACRETSLVVDAWDQNRLSANYDSILKVLETTESKHADNEGRVLRLLNAFNGELGTEYGLFEYYGHAAPEHVLVVFGTVEASIARQVAEQLSAQGKTVGVVNVRVYRPFVEEEFLKALPASVHSVGVLGQVEDESAATDSGEHSLLYKDVLASLSFSDRQVAISDLKYARSQAWTPAEIVSAFVRLTEQPLAVETKPVQEYSFWNIDSSSSVAAPVALAQLLSSLSQNHVTVRTGHDNLTNGGVIRTDIRSSPKSYELPYSAEAADLAFVDGELLQTFDVLRSVKAGGALVVTLRGFKDDDLEKRLPAELRKKLSKGDVRLYVLDPAVADGPELESLLTEAAFLQLSGTDAHVATPKLANINGTAEAIVAAFSSLEAALRSIEIPEAWGTIEAEATPLPADISVNSFAPFDKTETEPSVTTSNKLAAAKAIVFKEAYGTKSALRPDLGVKTAIVHVKERRRLTPLTYDRNIFHIEFDLGNSGLTYAIGEALGIHAENDKADVEAFIKAYGLNPDEIVQVPSREESNVLEQRTVYQAFIQNIDIFGRPPKKFYEALSEFATDENERKNLLAVSTPDGAAEFKRRAEVDTITFADLLLEFPSAHPPVQDIVRIVSPMKRREYSIASSQNVTPNSVSLLIVTVGWVDPQGRDRFGQATRFLNGLHVGAPITVSVKPSVMKLPLKSTAPIIMAGLGTGLAPFRAFVQERALQKQRGEEIGAVLLYMGSRHQREEYLYGEEWEAYQEAGVITLIGRAFSRDQPQKIYIQDRMRQTMEEIRQAYLREEGSFYLCGPTWPVPDVTQVLQEAIEHEEKSKGAKKVDSQREIERLKEDQRYVLEVNHQESTTSNPPRVRI